jgi:hypothetical protein
MQKIGTPQGSPIFCTGVLFFASDCTSIIRCVTHVTRNEEKLFLSSSKTTKQQQQNKGSSFALIISYAIFSESKMLSEIGSDDCVRIHEFELFRLEFDQSMFEILSQEFSPYLQHVTNGRKGCISTCVQIKSSNDMVTAALVRSTTAYQRPAVRFTPALYHIHEELEKVSIFSFPFNNALVERYASQYKSMKFHSDQDLDLEDNTYIALFSCYRDPFSMPTRYLEVKNKESQEIERMIPLEHHSIVVFDVNVTNKVFQHRIVYRQENKKTKRPPPCSSEVATNSSSRHQQESDATDDASVDPDDAWMGVTFRTSKTFLDYHGREKSEGEDSEDSSQSVEVYFHNTSQRLRLADPSEVRNCFKLRRQENESKSREEFAYTLLDYTISPGDLLTPV